MQQLQQNIETLRKWVNEETNDHIRRLLIGTIGTAETMIKYNHQPGILSATVAVQKMADIYNRSENNSL